MMFFPALLVLATSFFTAVAEGLEVTFSVPDVLVNEEATPVHLNIVGGDLGNGEVKQIRTVLYTPGKRSPKFFANISHSDFVSKPGNVFELEPVYSLPTQQYKVGYSVLVSYETEKEWIDSELFDVRVEDPSLGALHFIASLVFFAAFVLTIGYLCVHLATPGFWEQRLPVWMHRFLPDQKQKRRN